MVLRGSGDSIAEKNPAWTSLKAVGLVDLISEPAFFL